MLYSVLMNTSKKVDVKVTDTTIEISTTITALLHRRPKGRPGQYSTVMEHMPEDHQKYLEWNGDRFRKWAERIGINTYTVVNAILDSKSVEQQTYREVVWDFGSLLRNTRCILKQPVKRLLSYTSSPSYKSILKHPCNRFCKTGIRNY